MHKLHEICFVPYCKCGHFQARKIVDEAKYQGCLLLLFLKSPYDNIVARLNKIIFRLGASVVNMIKYWYYSVTTPILYYFILLEAYNNSSKMANGNNE